MEVKVEVKLTKKEMFNFMMRHNYTTFGGICGILISLGALVMFIMNFTNDKMSTPYKVALVAIALLFTVIQPIMLYIKSAAQVKNNGSVNKPLIYSFDSTGITISKGDESVTNKYEDVTKIISTKLSVIIYISKYRAFIIPKSCLENSFEEFKQILIDNVNCSSITIK